MIQKGKCMCGSTDFFAHEEREKFSDAAWTLTAALEALGLEELDNLDIDEPCADRHCCKFREARLSLGSYSLDKVHAVTVRLAEIKGQLDAARPTT
ncbi:hypothetical protein [Streptomyces sp. NPDC007172]|uniref:hypothetical protein n=1 Tax=Streptomyces sp. NPDC007172 TaxID=3364776 RepID=UPI00369698FE